MDRRYGDLHHSLLLRHQRQNSRLSQAKRRTGDSSFDVRLDQPVLQRGHRTASSLPPAPGTQSNCVRHRAHRIVQSSSRPRSKPLTTSFGRKSTQASKKDSCCNEKWTVPGCECMWHIIAWWKGGKKTPANCFYPRSMKRINNLYKSVLSVYNLK